MVVWRSETPSPLAAVSVCVLCVLVIETVSVTLQYYCVLTASASASCVSCVSDLLALVWALDYNCSLCCCFSTDIDVSLDRFYHYGCNLPTFPKWLQVMDDGILVSKFELVNLLEAGCCCCHRANISYSICYDVKVILSWLWIGLLQHVSIACYAERWLRY